MPKAWKVTVREGSKVSRDGFDDLDSALAAAREAIDRSRRGGRMAPAKGIGSDYAPGDQVQCRTEVSGKGFLRGPEAGIDLMGDGAIVAYTGTIRKERLAADSLDEAVAAVLSALA